MKPILSIHQPDFLPYSGLFHKIAKSDVFLVDDYDQYSTNGYHSRVKINDEWVSELVVDKKKLPINTKIKDVCIDADRTIGRIYSGLDRLHDAPYLKKARGLVRHIVSKSGVKGIVPLTQFNVMFISYICKYLEIDTLIELLPNDYSHREKELGIEDIMNGLYPEHIYLSGIGGKVYLSGTSLERSGRIMYSKHKMNYSDSILSVVAYEKEPLQIVMMEDEI